MTRIITYQIDEQHNGYSITRFLKEEGFCHQTMVYLKRTPNGVLLNNNWVHMSESLQSGDNLMIQWEEPKDSSRILPVYHPLNIVYEDEDILVINKDSNMPVHPSMGNYENTLANAVMYHYRDSSKNFTYRCINRLDKDTTGLTIIAKNCQSAGRLSNDVSQKRIKRTYLAIVEGCIQEKGTITAPIGRKDGSTIERMVDFENGEHAVTHYWPLSYQEQQNLSLIKLQLETGRTHQIRVHMKHIGHPLIGDFLYNPDMGYMERQALHSYKLEFTHPITHEALSFTVPLPNDMSNLFSLDEIV